MFCNTILISTILAFCYPGYDHLCGPLACTYMLNTDTEYIFTWVIPGTVEGEEGEASHNKLEDMIKEKYSYI